MSTTQNANDAPEHVALVLDALAPEVDQDDAQTIQGVEDDGADEDELTKTHDRVLVGAHDRVVGLRADAHECGVENVDEQEEEDGHTGNTVQDPRPHAGVAAVKRAARTGLLF